MVQIITGRTLPTFQSAIAVPAKLNVTTFNVWGLPSWLNQASPNRYRKIANELARLGSDAVLLQEVWTHKCFAELSGQSKGSTRTWWAAYARHKVGFLGQNGLLTLSRYPINGAEIMHFNAADLPDSLMNKGALKITITIGTGERFNIWNVHLQDGGSVHVRSQQIAQLISWIQASHDGQVADIVGGDFNFTPESTEYLKFAAAVGPSVYQLSGDVAFPTWDGLKLIPGGGQAIDHIFVRIRKPSDEVQARPRRIFAASRAEDRLSDHMGMEAFLTFGSASENGPPLLAKRTDPSAALETSALNRR